MRLLICVGLFVAAYDPLPTQAESEISVPDRLAEALKQVGFDKADLGFRPKGYWSRFPDPQDVPYKLHFFDSLFAEPLRVYDFSLVMAQATRDLLSAQKFSEQPDSLFKLVYFLGIEHKVFGFRGYSANLDPRPAEKSPLVAAAHRAYEAAGGQMRIVIFGKKADWPDPEAEIQKQLQGVDPQLERIVASLLLNVIDAWSWRNLALRNVDGQKLRAVFQMRDFHGHSTDGQSYPYQVDDVAKDLDAQSLYYSAQKAVQAAHDAARELRALVGPAPEKFQNTSIRFETPIGRVIVAGTGNDSHQDTDAAILIDLGGNDSYQGSVGATTALELPVSIAIDLSGDDSYQCSDERRITQGAGIFGAGILIDLSGNDTYQASRGAQGYGLFGLGLLADYDGNDSYTLGYSGQGAGYFGIGLHLDAAGDDRFYIYGDGQGFGGTGGVGVLANVSGNDTYTAEPLAEKAGRPDYHSEMKIAVNQAQGCGAGMRADGSHGHAWAGGLGALIDLAGNDQYESGNWSLGTGYWFGTGILYDGGGDDTYRSVYFSQASGAHFCIGALIDEAGNDRHLLHETAGAGLAFGWDYAVALLIDKGGDDAYEARQTSIANAQIRSNAILIDIGGNDTYALAPGVEGMGSATFLKSYTTPSYQYGPYSLYANSIALLLDIGGEDRYLAKPPQPGEPQPFANAGNNRSWLKPAQGSKEYGYRSFGIGFDVETGTVPDVFIGSPGDAP
jgi:hypothetical protein